MTIEKLERVQYWTAQKKIELKNLTGEEFEHDFTHYHDARAMLHEKAQHDWGVATGLEVCQTGVQQLRVSPGVAIDRAGRLIALSDSDAGPQAAGGIIATSAQDFSDLGPKSYVVIRYGTQDRGKDDPVHPSKKWNEVLLEPTVQLMSQKDVEGDPDAVVLAVVELEQDGKVKSLAPSHADNKPARKLVGVPAGEIRLRRSKATKDGDKETVSDTVAVTLRPTKEGDGVEIVSGKDGTVQMVIKDGNVGIGIPKPLARLHVTGGDLRVETGTVQSPGKIILQPGVDTNGEKAVEYKDTSEIKTGNAVMKGAVNDYQKAQFTMSGGGTVTWSFNSQSKSGRLKWTQRFIAIGMGGDGTAIAAKHISADYPKTKDAVKSWDKKDRWTDAGIELKEWEALYAIHQVGGNQTSVEFQIYEYRQAFEAPSNWLLIAVLNGDDGTVKLGTGATVSANSGLFEGSPVSRGTILMWSGDADKIPFGWAICDGTNGTPDLVGRFVMGAKQGSTPAAKSKGDADTHSHVIPSVTATSDTAGEHQHATQNQGWYIVYLGETEKRRDQGGRSMIDCFNNDPRSALTGQGGNHSHHVEIPGQTSGHSTGPNRPAWYALCYIMKL